MRVPFALRPAGSNRKSDMDDIVDEGRDDGDGDQHWDQGPPYEDCNAHPVVPGGCVRAADEVAEDVSLLLVKLSLLHKDVPPRKRSNASTIAQAAIRHAAK